MFHLVLTLAVADHFNPDPAERVTAMVRQGNLIIDGTRYDDMLTIVQDGRQIEVHAEGEVIWFGPVPAEVIIDTWEGNDMVVLDTSDRVVGQVHLGHGDDVLLNRGEAPVRASGGPGNDLMVGGYGYDLFFGDEGNDTLRGGPGNDELIGGPGDDFLAGQRGVDFTAGDDGHDFCKVRPDRQEPAEGCENLDPIR